MVILGIVLLVLGILLNVSLLTIVGLVLIVSGSWGTSRYALSARWPALVLTNPSIQ